ncbi:MAG TPA: Gmad2 immunoglobulin-like domain-containing protein [Patescibacteria group bacterium]|nr:Gmad2 immunoglobulin-like domain-containing protein [Patescibacteria group bacterium]
MSQLLRIILIVLVLGAAVLVWVELKQEDEVEKVEEITEVEEVAAETEQTTYGSEKGVELIVTSPLKDSVVTSPLTITGEAPGLWYFEATFPVTLVNWDGLIIAEGYATAQGEWMTEDYVPFTATLEFTDVLPLTEGIEDLSQVQEFMKKGALILRRDNPSGLPQNDDAVEFSIRFAE